MASDCNSGKHLGIFKTLDRCESREESRLQSYLRKEQISVNLGAGLVRKFGFDEANKAYLDQHFPDLDENAYCFPLVFEYKHPGESLELRERWHVPSTRTDKLRYDTLMRERRGELPEEQVIKMFSGMFKEYKIPSFIIHGYQWKKHYLNQLRKLSKNKALNKLFNSVLTSDGETDMLISLPDKCLIAVEIKAVAKECTKQDILRVVGKAFEQCDRTVQFVSKIISIGNPIGIIKVAAIPNCTRADIEGLVCANCCSHIITSEDLKGLNTLYGWFLKILQHCNREISVNLSVHSNIVGCLVGPASLTKDRPSTAPEAINRTVEQIEKEHGTLQNVKEHFQWFQLTPAQLSVRARDPQFLFLLGPPGSGKTLLALSKAEEILTNSVSETDQESPNISAGSNITDTATGDDETESRKESVLYIFLGAEITCLRKLYQDKLKGVQRGNCELYIKNSDISTGTELQLPQILNMIKRLKIKHREKIVHVIFDECLIDTRVSFRLSEALVGVRELGYVWFITDPIMRNMSGIDRVKDMLEDRGLFCWVRLHYVMRMSRQNIELTNTILSTTAVDDPKFDVGHSTLEAGHAINGLRPSVYRMKCVCIEPNYNFICPRCATSRWMWLLGTVKADLRLKNEDFIFLMPNKESLDTITRNREPFKWSVDFRGCEGKVIIVFLSSLFLYESASHELTRSLGKLVIIDIGCGPGSDEIRKYDQLIGRINREAKFGNVEIKEVKPSVQERGAFRHDNIVRLGNDIALLSLKNNLDEMD